VKWEDYDNFTSTVPVRPNMTTWLVGAIFLELNARSLLLSFQVRCVDSDTSRGQCNLGPGVQCRDPVPQ
jgi:hypothetical protein